MVDFQEIYKIYQDRNVFNHSQYKPGEAQTAEFGPLVPNYSGS
jgi:hypothetical protein